ncbi:hypothetical protein [Paenibacillus sp. RUD330]|uniref:hypothetical protein n=1 Tax=Paenibacillus sp. RUD330 TaxID=2023772 RepID=UPI0012FD09B3|nr:hypothetical protein [Paenibacillus sp. RUD330]QID16055.1 hypothetical protein CIC07_25325 [Paenibacillus sp. RUD330]
MAVYEVSGSISCASSASAATALIVTVSGTSLGAGSLNDVSPVVIMISAGSSNGSASATAEILNILTFTGESRGSAAVSSPTTSRYIIMSGKSAGSAEVETFVSDRDVSEAIRGYVPDFLRGSSLFSKAQVIQSVEMIRLLAKIEQLRRDMFAGQRQTPEPITSDVFKTVVNRFHGSLVTQSPADYKVTTTILSVRGVPEDIVEMDEVVGSTLPAHLDYEIIPTFLPWDEIEEVSLTWNQVEQIPSWDQLETTFLIPVEEVLRRNGIT